MKRTCILWFLAGLLPLVILAATATATGASASEQSSRDVELWKQAATQLGKITGIAISPLLGTAAVGAWDWWHAKSPQARARLPWYASPYYWLPALLLVLAVAFKDAAGTSVPPALKKPLDVAEAIENKVSGLVAAGAVVPFLAAFIPMSSGATSGSEPHVVLAGFAAFNWASVLNILTVPFALVVFGLVWLSAHAINVLILLSPWGVVDAALKSFRTFLLSLVTMTHFINPLAGMILSLLIIVLAYFLAGWSFRLLVFGMVYIWDFVTVRRKRFQPAPDANWMFTARRIGRTPIRTYGKLRRDPTGTLVFEYRPWLVGKPQSLSLPAGDYAVGVGLFYPEILLLERKGDKEKRRTMLVLPPRYRTHEREVAVALRITELRDVGLLRGFKAAVRWLKALLGLGAKAGPAPAASTA